VTRLPLVVLWCLACCLPACARNYRLDDSLSVSDAPADVFRLVWQKKLVRRSLLDFRPQEWATAAIDDGGRLYVGSSAGVFWAFDADGRTIWSHKALGSISSRPTVDGSTHTVYFGADDGRIYALDSRSGARRWTYATQGTVNTPPVLSEGFVLFTTSEGRIYALDADSGKWRWQYDRELPEGFTIQGHAGVAVKQSTAFTGFADGTLVGLRVFSGDVVWTRNLGGGKKQFVDVDATPVVVGDMLVTSSYARGVHAISTDTGSIRWQYPVEGASAVTVDRGRIFFTAPEVGVVALDLAGHLAWRQAVPKGVPSVPVARGPYLFITGTETGLFAVDAASGRLLQYFDPGHGISAAPAVGAGYLTALTNQGQLYLFLVPSLRTAHAG